jgi:hypothetical protein
MGNLGLDFYNFRCIIKGEVMVDEKNVVGVVLDSGEEIIAELVERNDYEVTIKGAIVIIPNKGHLPWPIFADRENPEPFTLKVKTVYKPGKAIIELYKGYRSPIVQASAGLQLPGFEQE